MTEIDALENLEVHFEWSDTPIAAFIFVKDTAKFLKTACKYPVLEVNGGNLYARIRNTPGNVVLLILVVTLVKFMMQRLVKA